MARKRGPGGINGAVPLPPKNVLGLEWASTTRPARVGWLLPGAIPTGSVVLLEGRKATGKSSVAASFAAAVTGGPAIPGWTSPTHRSVIWVASEDSWESVVVPRLDAAGAILARVGRLEIKDNVGRKRRLVLPDDIVILGDVLRDSDAALLVLDPYVSLAHPSLDVRIEQQARTYLEPLAELLAGLGVVGLLTRHLRKGTGGDARESGLGSVAVANVARSVLRCDEHPYEPGRHVLSVVASNYSQRMPTQVYVIAEGTGNNPRVEWEGSCSLDADVIAEGRGTAAERDEWSDADRLLYALIGDGWGKVGDILAEAEAAQITPRALRRAKERLRIPSRRVDWGGHGYWEWGKPKLGWPPNLLVKTPEGGGHARRGAAMGAPRREWPRKRR